MNGDPKLYALLEQLGIVFEYIEHPPAPTIEIARQYWAGYDAKHCKNLFFRNHKGDRHYLVILDCDCDMDIHAIEKQLRQGKLSFASEKRMEKYLGVQPGYGYPFRSDLRYGTSRAPVFRQKPAKGETFEFSPLQEYRLADYFIRRLYPFFRPYRECV